MVFATSDCRRADARAAPAAEAHTAERARTAQHETLKQRKTGANEAELKAEPPRRRSPKRQRRPLARNQPRHAPRTLRRLRRAERRTSGALAITFSALSISSPAARPARTTGCSGRRRSSRAAAAAAAFRSSRAAVAWSLFTSGGRTGVSCAERRAGQRSASASPASSVTALLQARIGAAGADGWAAVRACHGGEHARTHARTCAAHSTRSTCTTRSTRT
jgi:hypothetical protein